MAVMGVGKSEWPGSDDGQDNITCLERGAILRPRLGCELKCETVARCDGEDNVRVYGDPALTKPNRQSLGTVRRPGQELELSRIIIGLYTSCISIW